MAGETDKQRLGEKKREWGSEEQKKKKKKPKSDGERGERAGRGGRVI